MITHLNLFAPDPLFAFSALTVRMALVFITLTFLFSLTFPTVTANPVGIIYPLAVVVPMSLAAFFLPLMGIHEAMAREKRRLRAGVRERVEKVIEAIHGLADGERAPELGAVQVQKELLAALLIEEDAIHKTLDLALEPEHPAQPPRCGAPAAGDLSSRRTCSGGCCGCSVRAGRKAVLGLGLQQLWLRHPEQQAVRFRPALIGACAGAAAVATVVSAATAAGWRNPHNVTLTT